MTTPDRPLAVGAPPPRGFGYRGAETFYPCSVVKVFYLVAAQARLEEGYLTPHDELDRARNDMILYSSNAATNYVIELVTGTTGDTLLTGAELAEWTDKRNWINPYLGSFGWPEFTPININQKLMYDLRYGRERMYAGTDGHNHNRLTTDATARLFHAIFTGQVISAERSRVIADLLRRPLDPAWIAAEPPSQVVGYFGQGLPSGSRLWSKAGWTEWTHDPTASYRRHDAAYVELPGGRAFTLVVFTQGKKISADLTCCRRSRGAQPIFAPVSSEPIDERVDHPNRIVLVDPVVQAFRKQRALLAIRPLNKAPHPIPRKSRSNRIA